MTGVARANTSPVNSTVFGLKLPTLHTGSVPTLYHLLLPASNRPKTFDLGQRTYDPKHVGYDLSATNPVFTFNVSSDGGSNAGHEFTTNLTDPERWDLVEYLKTL